MINLVKNAMDSEIFLAAIKLGQALLVNGNSYVQNSFLVIFAKNSDSCSSFFRRLFEYITAASNNWSTTGRSLLVFFMEGF